MKIKSWFILKGEVRVLWQEVRVFFNLGVRLGLRFYEFLDFG